MTKTNEKIYNRSDVKKKEFLLIAAKPECTLYSLRPLIKLHSTHIIIIGKYPFTE